VWLSPHPDVKKTKALYATASKLHKQANFVEPKTFAAMLQEAIIRGVDPMPAPGIIAAFVLAAESIYEGEGLHMLPELPSDELLVGIEGARFRDRLDAYIATRSDHERTRNLIFTCFATSFCALVESLPESALYRSGEGKAGAFAIALVDVLPNPGQVIQNVLNPFLTSEIAHINLFNSFTEQAFKNLFSASGYRYPDEKVKVSQLIYPADSDAPAHELVISYLKHTPFFDLFFTRVPFDLPQSTRFEHHWIVAGSGHGKTQTLQYLIARDLETVARREASVVVIDSQGDLIRTVSRLKFFADNPDTLCLIDPTDIEYPVALNLFDVGMERINRYSPLDRERLINGVLELYDFVLGSLLSAELTQKQAVIFRYITRLMLHIPDANIQTLRELMEPHGYEKYKPHIDKLQGTARAFFETEFNSREFSDTKRQVVRRLWGILENPTFERMFSHPKNKLDLFSEMNAGKVILINTAKELLKQNGTELFGRFFIAMIAQAAQERATIAKRMPTFVYIDECQDYLDNNVSLILEQARKFNVGMILAHQYIGQLPPKLHESFAANTSIKFAGGVSDKDARAFANMLRTTPEFIEEQPKGHFAAFVRNMTPHAVSLRVPFGRLEAMERLSPPEWEALRGQMRSRYAVPYSEVQQSIAAQLETPVLQPQPVPEPVSTPKVQQPLQAKKEQERQPPQPSMPKPTVQSDDAAKDW